MSSAGAVSVSGGVFRGNGVTLAGQGITGGGAVYANTVTNINASLFDSNTALATIDFQGSQDP